MTVLLAVCLLIQITTVSGHWRHYCETKRLPLVKIGRAAKGDSFVILERWQAGDADAPDLSSLKESGFHRQLQTQPLSHLRALHGGDDHIHVTASNNTDLFFNESSIFMEDLEEYYAKECTCFHELYTDLEISLCPLATTDCREIINNHVEGFPRSVTCYDRNDEEQRLLQATIFIWLFFLGWLLLTHRGRSALSYIPAKICKCWNPLVASFALQHRKKFSYFLIRNHILVQEEQLLRQAQQQSLVGTNNNNNNNDSTNNNSSTDGITVIEMATLAAQPPPPKLPSSLLLKTRIVQSEEIESFLQQQAQEDSDPDDNNDQLLCTICLAEILPGTKVGDFRQFHCNHLFHSECLKLWLQRRNTCPLCQTQEVAQPRYDDDDKDDNDDPRQENQATGSTTTEEVSADTTTNSEVSGSTGA